MRRGDPTRWVRCWPAPVLALTLACAAVTVEEGFEPAAVRAAAGGNDTAYRRVARGADANTSLDPYLDLLGDALTPAVATLFDDLQHSLRAVATPLPERVRAQLRPFFTGQVVGGVRLASAVLERAVFAVDPERARQLFALSPDGTVAITLGDVITFAPGQYRPDCVEGLALVGHELVHVAQYTTLGRERFLERYFLTETLKRLLSGGLATGAVDPARNQLEVDAYCHQEEICRALARAGALPPCGGREVAQCSSCPRIQRTPESRPGGPTRQRDD